ncbi:hypothetical protein MASR2M78_22190 [Treponema sp.]
MALSDSDEEDVRAIHRILTGDAASYRLIVIKYADRMLSFCRSHTSSEEDAADAAQETFIRAYRSLSTFKLGSSFAAWLFAIAANRTRTLWARRTSERKKIESAQAEASVQEQKDPEETALRKIEAEQIRNAVTVLSKDLRDSVELYYFAELSIAEIASMRETESENPSDSAIALAERVMAEITLQSGTAPRASAPRHRRIRGRGLRFVPAIAGALAACAVFVAMLAFQDRDTVAVRFVLEADSAQSVYLAGDFSSWKSEDLALRKNKDGLWERTVRLRKGQSYTYNFLVDGSSWVVDPAASERVDDGFGGESALIRL